VGVTPTQGQQTEGEQPEEKRDVEFELDVEPELGFEEAQATATVRVSGTEGVQYLGSYGNRREQRQVVEVRTLGAEPVDYLVEFQPGSDEVNATFQKRSPGTGMLRVEILTDSRVQKVQETTAAFGGVTVSWKA